MKGTTGKHTDQYLHLPPFFRLSFSKSPSNLPFPAFGSASSHPISPVQSWAMFCVHPVMCPTPKQQCPWSERCSENCSQWPTAMGSMPRHWSWGCAGTAPGRLVVAWESLTWASLWACACWPLGWWLLWWTWEQPARGLFGLLPCYCISELLCGCADRLFSQNLTLSPYSHPLSRYSKWRLYSVLLKHIPKKECMPARAISKVPV